MKLGQASGTLCVAIMAALGSQAAAANDDSGWYVGGNYGWTAATIDDERIISSLASRGITVTGLEEYDTDNGFKFFGGYQFNRWFAVEGGYVDLGEYGFLATTLPAGTLAGHIELRGVNLDLVGTLPISDRFKLFARVGALYAQADTTFVGTGAINVLDPNPTESDVNYKFGVGAEYAFTEALSLRVEAERYRINDAVGNLGDIDMLSAGLVYRFGRHVAAVAAPVAMAPTVTCADLDDDRDGVNNCDDRCPATVAGEAVGMDGCPLPPPMEPAPEPIPYRG